MLIFCLWHGRVSKQSTGDCISKKVQTSSTAGLMAAAVPLDGLRAHADPVRQLANSQKSPARLLGSNPSDLSNQIALQSGQGELYGSPWWPTFNKGAGSAHSCVRATNLSCMPLDLRAMFTSLPGVKGNLHDPGVVTLSPGHQGLLSQTIDAD